MDYCLNGFGIVVIVVAIRYVYQIVRSSVTGDPLDRGIQEFVTAPTILYLTGAFTFGSAYGIYLDITNQLGIGDNKSFLYLLIVVFIFSAILFYGGISGVFRKKKP